MDILAQPAENVIVYELSAAILAFEILLSFSLMKHFLTKLYYLEKKNSFTTVSYP